MKLQIKTTKFKEMLSKAVKGASNNKLIPLTSLIAITRKDGTLTLTTTDATNYVYVSDEQGLSEYFYTVCNVDTLYKLVSKMTSDEITLDTDGSYLTVTGNGTYKIELPLDEDGNVVNYPNPIESFSKVNKIGSVDAGTIHRITTSVKPSLMATAELPQYTCYYVGDSVIATDTFKISSLAKSFLAESKLVSAEVMNLLDNMDSNTQMTIYTDSGKMLFESNNYSILGTEPVGIENFSIDAINGLVSQPFAHRCEVVKDDMLRLLDRIALFVGVYDNGEITLNFTPKDIKVSSKLANGVESLKYVDSGVHTEFVCAISIDNLITQVKSQTSDSIQIWYGEDNAIKLVDGDVTSVIALLDD